LSGSTGRSLMNMLHGKKGALLAKFLSDVADKLFFTVITVNDELNAFQSF
jgi:hypothetical protein